MKTKGLALLARARARPCGRRGRRRARHRHQPHRRGSDVPVPADLEVDPGLRPGDRRHGQLQRDRLGRRDRRDHEPHRRLRRLRRAAHEGSVRGGGEGRLGRRADPVGAVGDVDHVQRPRRAAAPEADRPRDRRHLPRQDHELERPGDHEAEQGREPAGPEDHADLPLRRLRHDLQLHRLPLVGQPGLQVEGRLLDAGRLPDRRRRRAAAPASPASSRAPTARSRTPTSRTRSRTSSSSRASRTGPASCSFPGLRGIAAAAATIKKVPADNEMHIVNPPKSQPLAYPISTFTYVLVPTKTSQGEGAAEAGLLGADAGPEEASTRRSSSSSRCRSRCSSRPRRR